jgi:hypothetical protein
MEGKTKTAQEIISPFVYGNYDNPDDASGLPEGDYIEESKCLEAMEIYAKQEVDEYKEKLLNFFEGVYHGINEWNRKDIINIIKKIEESKS